MAGAEYFPDLTSGLNNPIFFRISVLFIFFLLSIKTIGNEPAIIPANSNRFEWNN